LQDSTGDTKAEPPSLQPSSSSHSITNGTITSSNPNRRSKPSAAGLCGEGRRHRSRLCRLLLVGCTDGCASSEDVVPPHTW
jgi:hypothetical protein